MIGKHFTAVLLSGVLVACSGAEDPSELDAGERAEAASLQQQFEAARAAGSWEVAEAHADELRRRFPGSEASQGLDANLAQVREQAEAARETRRLRDLWTYQSTSVPGEARPQRTATIYSRTPPVGEGEPAITPDARLVLRDHPAWGRSAYLLLAQSRFECPSPCSVRIRFDAGQAQDYAARQADSGQGPALFIEDEKRFEAALAQARELKIQLPKGSGSVSSLGFEVGGFSPPRYDRPQVLGP